MRKPFEKVPVNAVFFWYFGILGGFLGVLAVELLNSKWLNVAEIYTFHSTPIARKIASRTTCDRCTVGTKILADPDKFSLELVSEELLTLL